MGRRWSRLLVDAIDPVLADSPFQEGQTGEPPTAAFNTLSPRRGSSRLMRARWLSPSRTVRTTKTLRRHRTGASLTG